MKNFKIPSDAKLFNNVDLITATRNRNSIDTFYNYWIGSSGKTCRIKKNVYIDKTFLNSHNIEKITDVKFIQSKHYGENFSKNTILKISPKFLHNFVKFTRASGTAISEVHQKILKNSFDLYANESRETGITIITQCYHHVFNGYNVIYLTGFALCVDNKIVYSYNMKPVNINSLVLLTEKYLLQSRENIWWIPNWVLKDKATTTQIELSKKIKYPKYLRDELKRRERQLLLEKIVVNAQEKIQQHIENKKEDTNMLMQPLNHGLNAGLVKPLITTDKAEIYKKLVKAISESKTIYYGDYEIVDVAYSSSLKNRYILNVYVKGSELPINIETTDIAKFAVVEKVKLF